MLKKEKNKIRLEIMNNRQLKDFLKESLDMEKELYDFCIQALTKLYPDNVQRAISLFEDSYNFYEYNSYLQSLCCIDSKIKQELKEIEEMKAIKAKKDKKNE